MAPVPNKPTVSVSVKQHFNFNNNCLQLFFTDVLLGRMHTCAFPAYYLSLSEKFLRETPLSIEAETHAAKHVVLVQSFLFPTSDKVIRGAQKCHICFDGQA